MSTTPDTINGKTSYAELEAIIVEATARQSELYQAELERLLRDVEARCEALKISPEKLFTLFRKGKRGRPRKASNDAE